MRKLLITLCALYSISNAGIIQQQVNTITYNFCNNDPHPPFGGGTQDLNVFATAPSMVLTLSGSWDVNYNVHINNIYVPHVSTYTKITTIPYGSCAKFIATSQDSKYSSASYSMIFETAVNKIKTYINFSDINTKIINGVPVNTLFYSSSSLIYNMWIRYNSGLDDVISYTQLPEYVVTPIYIQSEKFVKPNNPYDYEIMF